MDCDTTGIEPDFALVKFKKLAGGGYFKIINQSVPEALRARLHAAPDRRDRSLRRGHASLRQSPAINHRPEGQGLHGRIARQIESGLAAAFDIKFVFNRWTLGDDFLTDTLKVPAEKLDDPAFDLFAHLGFTKKDVEAANEYVCGAMTLEGAPHLQARAPLRLRLRQSVRPQGQALSLGREPHPHDGGVPAVHLGRHLEDDQHAERRHRRRLQAGLHALWKLALKANALYRDGSKLRSR